MHLLLSATIFFIASGILLPEAADRNPGSFVEVPVGRDPHHERDRMTAMDEQKMRDTLKMDSQSQGQVGWDVAINLKKREKEIRTNILINWAAYFYFSEFASRNDLHGNGERLRAEKRHTNVQINQNKEII